MDHLSLASVGILVEDGNDGTSLGGDHCSSCDDGNICDLMVVDPLDVYRAPCLLNDTDISSGNASICSMINQ